MVRRLKILIIPISLVGCLVVGVGIGKFISVRQPVKWGNALRSTDVIQDLNNPVIKAYLASMALPFKASTTALNPEKEWDFTIAEPGQPKIRIQATHGIGGNFYCKFSDEELPRIIGRPSDYVLPCDIRYNAPMNRIYAKASGILAVGGRDTEIFEFDIKTRKTISDFHINPDILPPDPIL